MALIAALLLSLPAAVATAPTAAQSPDPALAVVATPVSPQAGAASMETDRLEFAWGLDIATGRDDLVDFTGYAMEWSSLRLADGRILSLAYRHGAGAGPEGVRNGRLGAGVPSSSPVDESQVFRAPRNRPQIDGHAFRDAFRVSDSVGSVGLWTDDSSGEGVLIAFGEATASASIDDYVILGRTGMEAEVISASAPLHGGPTSVSVASRPAPDGTFRILTYRWRRGS